MDDYEIGHATAADLPELVALLGVLFGIEQDFRADTEKQFRGLSLLIAEPRAVVLTARPAGGPAVAVATAQLVISTAEGAMSAWIEDVVVAEAHRGRGLGTRLLAAALDWARGAGATRAQLLVDLDNAPALDFYAALGWTATRLAARRMSFAAR
ncbi:MAG TPA: GNAT family N-acetyltransferase [Rhodocyclaceae bacterium]|nr:GNAT family N-acetyltransferase [Rhodocyclaceae bacterium]